MLNKNQAQATVEALLHERPAEQAARAAQVAGRRNSLAKRRWAAIGALIGFAAGSLLGALIAGDVFPANMLGLASGLIIGRMRDKRPT